MGLFARLAAHEELFQGMTDRVGADVSTWVYETPRNAAAYRTAMFSCTACTSGEACADWQASHDHAEAAPDFCRNRRMLNAIAGL